MAYLDTAVEEPQTPSTERVALVKRLTEQVLSAKKHWKPAYDRMRTCMKFASGQHYKRVIKDDERLQVDIVQRHISSRTAALYMRNPTVLVKRKKRLEFGLWDGTRQSLEKLYLAAQTGQIGPDETAMMQDVVEGFSRKRMMTTLGKTLQIMIGHSLDNQDPPFKTQAKQLIPRTLTCGVSYIRVGYQRELTKRPDTQAKLYDVTDRLATLERLAAKVEKEDGQLTADLEEARILRASLEQEPDVLVREGVVYSFPRSTTIIPDKRCMSLEGFLGCHWVAEEHLMDSEEIEEVYKKKVAGKATKAPAVDGKVKANTDECDTLYRVWEIFHKKHGVVYVVCEGFDDFLQEPAPPEVWTERFWNHETLIFNKHENEEDPFPKSDVFYLIPLQKEVNRTLEALRQHRIASRPLYVSRTGLMDKTDKKKISEHEAHEVIELSIGVNEDINKVITELKKANIDPNLYTLDPVYDAILRVSGSQEANLGGTSNSSATESSIAEASRISSLSSNTDDLDDLLTAVCDNTAKLHLRETSEDTVVRLVGPGAVWPTVPDQDLVDEIAVSVRAGSSGRPNRDKELANMERATPLILQLEGVKSEPLVQRFIDILDDSIDLEDFYDPQLPSMTARNAAAGRGAPQVGTGDPATDPNQQGGRGGSNAPAPALPAPGGQPAYPADAPLDNSPGGG